MVIDLLRAGDWPAVRAIYQAGIATGDTTFETVAAAGMASWSCSPRRSPMRSNRLMLTPQDVRETAAACRRALQPLADLDWDAPAGDLEWSCRTTLSHTLSALLFYAVNLTLRSTSRGPPGRRTRRYRSRSCWTRWRDGPRCWRRCPRPRRPRLAGRTSGGWPTRRGSPPWPATSCWCTPATSPPGSAPASTRRGSSAPGCWRACSPGRPRTGTRGRPCAGQTVARTGRAPAAGRGLGRPPRPTPGVGRP
jgi:hypothetical protein